MQENQEKQENLDMNNNKNNVDSDMLWTIVQSYFKKDYLKSMVRHQLESMNYFMNTLCVQTINMFHPVTVHSYKDIDPITGKHALEIKLEFVNFKTEHPKMTELNGISSPMFPQDARLRNMTYASSMYIDLNIQYIIRTGETMENVETMHNTINSIYLGKMPVMVKSALCNLTTYKHLTCKETGECPYDTGGYFIIDGSEKTVLSQERAVENKICCYPETVNNLYYAEISSVPYNKCISPKKIQLIIKNNNNGLCIGLLMQQLDSYIPIFILFRAFGIESDLDIINCILGNENENIRNDMKEFLKSSCMESSDYNTQESAIDYITSVMSYTNYAQYQSNSILTNNQSSYTEINGEKEEISEEEQERLDKQSLYINTKKRERANDLINNELFPHCPTKDTKLLFLSHFVCTYIKVCLKYEASDNKDSYMNKRIDLTGSLLNNLWRNNMNRFMKDASKRIIREIDTGSWKSTNNYLNIINSKNIFAIFKATNLEKGIINALSTGDFTIRNNMLSGKSRVGVAQVLNRINNIAPLSHLRRLSVPLAKTGPLIVPRQLNATSWGMICPAESPEGPSVGLVKNLAIMTHVTIPSNVTRLFEIVKIELSNCNERNGLGAILMIKPGVNVKVVKVFVNGCLLGHTEHPIEFYTIMKNKKRMGEINIYTSVVFNTVKKHICIINEGGRMTRPLMIVKNGQMVLEKLLNEPVSGSKICELLRTKNFVFNDLLINQHLFSEPCIEYVDVDEQVYSYIALTPNDLYKNRSNRYTHMELRPALLFGITASCIPFPDYNQSPRNTYECAQKKQSMGIYAMNFTGRMETTAYILDNPQKPLVDTRMMHILNINKLPYGMNITVAIMSYGGYNQEDSILFNKGSVDRGLFTTTIYHTEKDDDKQKMSGDDEIRCKPDKAITKGIKYANYDKINDYGVVPENTLIENKDVIISKVVPIKETKEEKENVKMNKIKYTDHSKIHRCNEATYIDKNYIEKNGDGYTFAKVRYRSHRNPGIGDKFSSRHGQKGTMGNMIPEHLMPCDENGNKPDIIINPHAIPSRMTLGQLKETIIGKGILSMAVFGDGTAFENKDMDWMTFEQYMIAQGLHSKGLDILYDGATGKQLTANIFVGPVFYQRLKHMVLDKVHSRAHGPMISYTRQPTEGRGASGGLRIGEMEKDALVAHGASQFTKDRLLVCSDNYNVYVCNKCGNIVSYNDSYKIFNVESKIHQCNTCSNKTSFSFVNIPYAFKLLIQELMVMNVNTRLITTLD